MKVERSSKKKTSAAAAAKRARSSASGAEKSAFVSRFHVAQRDSVRKELDSLILQIDAQAKEIEKSLTFESLGRYRELVQKFVGIVVNELFVVEDKISVSPTGRQKSMVLVKRINESLEDLANNFLDRQSNLINFVARLDQLRGMLLDLYT